MKIELAHCFVHLYFFGAERYESGQESVYIWKGNMSVKESFGFV